MPAPTAASLLRAGRGSPRRSHPRARASIPTGSRLLVLDRGPVRGELPGLEWEDPDLADEDAAEATPRRRNGNLEHETGLEPATPTLATWRSTN